MEIKSTFDKADKIGVEQRGRCWVFTLNGLDVKWADWNTSNITEFIENLSKQSHIRFICGGVESGDKTNRLHFQGYVEFTKSVRYTAVGVMLDSRFKILKYRPESKGDNSQEDTNTLMMENHTI